MSRHYNNTKQVAKRARLRAGGPPIKKPKKKTMTNKEAAELAKRHIKSKEIKRGNKLQRNSSGTATRMRST